MIIDYQTSRILIVEDDESRCAWFKQQLEKYAHDVTCDIPQAIEWLKEREYSFILLDHDLADEHYLSDTHDDERTGYAIAAWLAKHSDRQRAAEIVIHSLNYAGAQRMLDTLHSAGRNAAHVPFHNLQAGLRL